MNSETAQHVWAGIKATALVDLRAALVASASRYARIRPDWALLSAAARIEADGSRTAAHDAFTDNCNILSRNMAEHGEDITWRTLLGTERKEIGDFACHLHCILGTGVR